MFLQINVVAIPLTSQISVWEIPTLNCELNAVLVNCPTNGQPDRFSARVMYFIVYNVL